MTIRFTDCYEGYYTGQLVSLPNPEDEAAIVALGFATTDLDGPDGSAALALVEHAAAHVSMGVEAPGSVAALLATAAVEYADDAAAATGGVPVGGLYNVAGAVHVRVS